MTALIALLMAAAGPESGRLALADLSGYKAALEDASIEAIPASFREIWGAPESFRGRRVKIEGRIRRRFRQPAVGAFPALSEFWLTSPEGNPICIVFPSGPKSAEAGSADVEFRGTFLKLVRYPGGDVERLAPLIVGNRLPEARRPIPPSPGAGPSGSGDFGMFLAAGSAGVVLAILASKHANRPVGRPIDRGPTPEFLDAEDADGRP